MLQWSWNNISSIDSVVNISVNILGGFLFLYGIIKGIFRLKLKRNQYKYLNLPMDEITKQSMKYYIQTRGQNIDPCTEDEYDTRDSFVSNELIKLFINQIFKNSESQYFIILADSGMGKTTFLLKLFFRYYQKTFKQYDIVLIPLSLNSAIDRIKEIQNKTNTILLLDGFDEDQYAMEDYAKRLDTICKETELFFKVIMTCRTQFFPDSKSEPKDTGKIKFGVGKKRVEFIKYYISPFNDEDIKKYLKKKYKSIFKRKTRLEAERVVLQCPRLMMRPMLLNYIDYLVNNDQSYDYTYQIYAVLIEKWIDRESIPNDVLNSFTNQLALLMFREKQLYRPNYEFKRICEEFDIEMSPLEAKSRSLLNRNAEGLYKFAHKSIYEYVLSKIAFDDMNFRRELIKSKFIGLDMADLFFEEMCSNHIFNYKFDNLSYMKFSNLLIENYDFSTCNLENCVFLNCNIINTLFDITKSNEIAFIDCQLHKVSFINSVLRKSIFSGSTLNECKFINADLIESNFTNTNNNYTKLKKNCDFTDANLMKANFAGTNFSFFECLKNANLVGVNLTGVILENVNFLRGKDLSLSKFKNSVLHASDLTNIIFSDSDLSNIKTNKVDFSDSIFMDCKLTNDLFENTIFNNSKMIGADIRHSIIQECKLHNINLNCAELSECKFIDCNLSINNFDGLKIVSVRLEGNCILDEKSKEYFMDRAAEFSKQSKENNMKYVMSRK